MKKITLTCAHALVKYLIAQKILIDGKKEPLFPGVFGIFGHGNVACLGQALEENQKDLPTYRGHHEQNMACGPTWPHITLEETTWPYMAWTALLMAPRGPYGPYGTMWRNMAADGTRWRQMAVASYGQAEPHIVDMRIYWCYAQQCPTCHQIDGY